MKTPSAICMSICNLKSVVVSGPVSFEAQIKQINAEKSGVVHSWYLFANALTA
jgi:hypothetical protein